MNSGNIMIIMALLILGTWITMAPKELPRETFNISVNGETIYHQQIPQGECSRHIGTARAMLNIFYTNSEIQQLLTEEVLEVKCIKLEFIDLDNITNSDNLTNSDDPWLSDK